MWVKKYIAAIYVRVLPMLASESGQGVKLTREPIMNQGSKKPKPSLSRDERSN